MKIINNEKGFTLVEIMVALLILLIAIIPMLYLLVNATHQYSEAADETRLVKYGEMIIEEIKLNPPSEDFEGYVTEDNEIKYEVEVSQEEAGEGIIMNKYSVTVYYSENGQEESILLTFLK